MSSVPNPVAIWSEFPTIGAIADSARRMVLVKDGADWVVSSTGPEDGAFFLVGDDYILVDLTPILGVYYDSGGTAQAIDPLTTPRLRAAALRGDVIFY